VITLTQVNYGNIEILMVRDALFNLGAALLERRNNPTANA